MHGYSSVVKGLLAFLVIMGGLFSLDTGMRNGAESVSGSLGVFPAYAADDISSLADDVPNSVGKVLAENSAEGKMSADTVPIPVLKGREMTPEIMAKYPEGKFTSRSVVNKAFGTGEYLVFSLDYGFYRAGAATMEVMGVEQVKGYNCYHIHTTAESNKFISSFYKVRDKVDSYIDTQGIYSRRFEKHLREGNYHMDELVDLYQDRRIALSTRNKYALVEIPLYVQDILSTLYYIRTFDLKVGKTETIETYADGKVYPLKVFVNKREKVEVPAGTFTCLQIEPQLKSEGIFRQKGRLLVWVTDDQYKMPVKMTSKVTIGSIASKLESYKK